VRQRTRRMPTTNAGKKRERGEKNINVSLPPEEWRFKKRKNLFISGGGNTSARNPWVRKTIHRRAERNRWLLRFAWWCVQG